MKYLAQSATANAAKEMAPAEVWAWASMLDVARTQNSSLLPPSRLSYQAAGGLNGGMSAMAKPYSPLLGCVAGMLTLQRSMDGVDGGRMTREDMMAVR